jgi:hypothetical protein
MRKKIDVTDEKLNDWQRGEDSTTPYEERLNLMNKWLSNNKLEILTKPVKDSTNSNIGFEDLRMYE